MVAYGQSLTRDNPMDSFRQAEVINKLNLVEMREKRAVVSFTCKKEYVQSKLKQELLAQDIPEHAANAIVEGMGVFVTRYDTAWQDYIVDSSGHGVLFQAYVWMDQSGRNGEVDVAMVVAGAGFDAAKQVEYNEEERIPRFEHVAEIQVVTESGMLWGERTRAVTVTELKELPPTIKKTPVSKQHMITKGDMDIIKQFLISRAFGEALRLHGPRDYQRIGL